MRTLLSGKVLELHKKTDKNDPTKVYNLLVVYEPGKLFTDLVRVSPDKVVEAATLVGKDADIEADVTIYQQKVNLTYVTGRTVADRRAA